LASQSAVLGVSAALGSVREEAFSGVGSWDDPARVDARTIPERVAIVATDLNPLMLGLEGTPLRNEIEARDAGRLQEITEAAADAVLAHFGEGPVSGKMQAHVITAVR